MGKKAGFLEEYFLGFDIGTGSVGWAVTDLNYKLIKINGKNAWGSVLFETSEGAQERRVNRCARRRHKREKERLELLREIFEEEVVKVDPGFFLRLQESKYLPEDKRDENGDMPELPYALFVDEDYTDVDYHKEFPTIYHLRKELMENKTRKFDVRLLYLAIAHMLKSRGHFLKNLDSDDKEGSFKDILNNLLEVWNSIMREEDNYLYLSDEQKDMIIEVLKNGKLTKGRKKQEIIKNIANLDKEFKELIALFTGNKVSFSKIFAVKEFDDLETNKISFEDADCDNEMDFCESNLQEFYDIIVGAKAVYDQMILSNVLRGDESGHISNAKVKDYEKHQYDLKMLKNVILKEFIGTTNDAKALYDRVFRMPKGDEKNYSVYVGRVSCDGGKQLVSKKNCDKKDFFDFIKKVVIPVINDGPDKDYIIEQIELGEFLPKLRIRENSVIPYQLNERELKIILSNAKEYMEFLNKMDESGITNSEKILMLLSFRIPYYVGPLNSSHENAWVKRLENGKVTPWNFEEKVDVDGSAQEFILKMTSKCTYLKKENVLPKGSLLYERYMVLSELNNLKIKMEPISVELKQEIYTQLFERNLKVTKKKLLSFLKREKGYIDITVEDITGIDGDFNSSLKSYHAFKQVFTGIEVPERVKEDIVKDITLFGAEYSILKRRLLTKYPEYEMQIPVLIKKLTCKDWGRLSEKLLNGLAVEEPGLGEVGTIIYKMWETNLNLMQILAVSDSPFLQMIEKENGDVKKNNIDYSLVEELYVAPATKRQIWKAMQVLQEVTKAMGHAPKRIFVEMTREHMESKRSVTRKDELTELYKSIKDEKELYQQLLGEENDKLRSDKLYLYYKQLGTCAYTGRKISLDEFANYDIDHIYPRSKTGDDSMVNKVLVYKPANEEKGDIYPIRNDVQEKMRGTWLVWKQKGLINDEKYYRLTRKHELSHEELTGFINRQLVETSQSTKAFTEVLKQIMPKETEIVYSKAKNVSRFRNERLDMVKVREMNDLHHAKDAYLNIVVGNVYHMKFTKDTRKYFMEKGTYRSYNLTKMFDFDISYGNEVAWVAGSSGSLPLVKKMLATNKVLVTRQVSEKKGVLFDVNPKAKAEGLIPLKSGSGDDRLLDTSKYGGYNGARISYFSIVEGVKGKGKVVKTFVPMPIYIVKKSSPQELMEYIEKETKLKDIKFIKEKVQLNTLLVKDGFRMRITGYSSGQLILNNDNQLILTDRYNKLLKEVIKFKKDMLMKKDTNINCRSGLSDESLIELYDVFIDKLGSTVYMSMLRGFENKLKNGRQKFVELSLEDKAIQIAEILKLFTTNAEMPDLLKIGGTKNQGRIRMSLNITDCKNLIIVHQSVTGLYEVIERIC